MPLRDMDYRHLKCKVVELIVSLIRGVGYALTQSFVISDIFKIVNFEDFRCYGVLLSQGADSSAVFMSFKKATSLLSLWNTFKLLCIFVLNLFRSS